MTDRQIRSACAMAAAFALLLSVSTSGVIAKPINSKRAVQSIKVSTNDIKVYLLAESIYFDVHRLHALVMQFQETSGRTAQQSLIKQMDILDQGLKARFRQFEICKSGTVSAKTAVARFDQYARIEQKQQEEDLASIHDDPSIEMEESFLAFSGSGPQDWLTEMRNVAQSAQTIKPNNLSLGISGLLELHNKIVSANRRLSSILVNAGKPRSERIKKDQLQGLYNDVEALANSSPFLRQRAAASIRAFESFSSGSFDQKSPGSTQHWKILDENFDHLSLAEAKLREELLTLL